MICQTEISGSKTACSNLSINSPLSVFLTDKNKILVGEGLYWKNAESRSGDSAKNGAWLSPAVGFDFPNAKATIYGEGKNKISWITIQDVAAFAVASVDNASAKNKTIELGGPDALSPLEVVALFEKAGGKKFELQHVPVEALQGQKNAATDDLSKSFANLMLTYAAGNEINMQQALKAFPVKLNSVRDYAKQVMVMSQPA